MVWFYPLAQGENMEEIGANLVNESLFSWTYTISPFFWCVGTYKSYNAFIWVKLHNIPLELWNNIGINSIGYAIISYSICDDGCVENNLWLIYEVLADNNAR